MTKLILGTATAIGLLLSPAMAQDAGTSTSGAQASPEAQGQSSATGGSDKAAGQSASASSSADKEAHDSATKRAEDAGMTNVTVLDRAFVLQGTNDAGNPVFMIVNPPGALIGIGGPVMTSAAGGTGEQASGSTGQQASGETEQQASSNTAGSDPQPGNPPESGYMATQVNPAPPEAWAPDEAMMEELWSAEAVGSAMSRMGLDKAQ